MGKLNNYCIFLRIYLLKISRGKRKKGHCRGDPKLKNSLREPAPDPVKRLGVLSFLPMGTPSNSHATHPRCVPLFSSLSHPLKWEREIIARKSITLETERCFTPQEKWITCWESSSRLKHRRSLSQKKIQAASSFKCETIDMKWFLF